MINTKKSPTVPPAAVHHRVRTTFAAIFGSIALSLISLSVLVVWANRTLTDTTTYVDTVAPLLKQAEVKDFVAQKVTDQLEESAPTQELADNLLAPEQVAGKTPEQLQAALAPVIHAAVMQVLDSPRFVQLWRQTNQTNHAELIRQLGADTPQITLDLGPFVTGVTRELSQTRLAPVSDQLELEPDAAKLDLKGSQIEYVHQAYSILKTATIVIVLLALLLAGLSVWISVHHLKTLRRMLVGTAVTVLLVAALIQVPSFVTFRGGDAVMQKALAALTMTLLHNLQIVCVVIGFGCLVVALASKLYEGRRHA